MFLTPSSRVTNMSFNVVYTADVHGNETQYCKLVDYAIRTRAKAVIIGGDIAPKSSTPSKGRIEAKKKSLTEHLFIDMQRAFFEERLPELVRPLKEQSPKTKLFLMMGNDDCSVNTDVLNKYDGELYHVIHGKRLPLSDHVDIVGYSCVPITPFRIKDWEKFDLSTVPPKFKEDYAQRKQQNYRFDGLKSTPKGWMPFSFSDEMEAQDSIQRDLSTGVFAEKRRRTMYVIHTPPNGTCLDQIAGQHHVGSFAVRLFIEKMEPYMTLHGHIHETVGVSGKFRERIGTSLCFSAGNDNVGEDLAMLVFDAHDLRTVERKII